MSDEGTQTHKLIPLDDREREPEGAAVAQLTFNADASPVGFHGQPAKRQAKTRATASRRALAV